MAIVAKYYNSKCLCCERCDKEMVKVGPMVFCMDCFESNFVKPCIYVAGEEIDSKCKDYKTWIKIYKNKE